jgi:hypothetical protein
MNFFATVPLERTKKWLNKVITDLCFEVGFGGTDSLAERNRDRLFVFRLDEMQIN